MTCPPSFPPDMNAAAPRLYVHVILQKRALLTLPSSTTCARGCSLPLLWRAINYSRVCTYTGANRPPPSLPNQYMYRKSARMFANAIRRDDTTRGREREWLLTWRQTCRSGYSCRDLSSWLCGVGGGNWRELQTSKWPLTDGMCSRSAVPVSWQSHETW